MPLHLWISKMIGCEAGTCEWYKFQEICVPGTEFDTWHLNISVVTIGKMVKWRHFPFHQLSSSLFQSGCCLWEIWSFFVVTKSLKAINIMGYAYLPTVLQKRSQTSESYRGLAFSGQLWACGMGAETSASPLHYAFAVSPNKQEVKNPKECKS